MKLGLSLALILGAMPCLAEPAAGVSHLSDTSDRARPLSLSIWYPSNAPASATVGGNPVFQGVAAAPDAPLPDRALPLVVVSHGGLRSASDSGAWLSASVARAGFIVAEVNAPRPGTAAIALAEIGQRPQDIRRALDLMLADSAWHDRIDRNRISVVGFALGGTAALSVAGAQLDRTRYMHSCDADSPAKGPDCEWYAAQGADLTQTRQEDLAQLARDPRVTSVIAMAPEYLSALNSSPVEASTLLITFGNTDQEQGNLPAAQSITISGASALDAFALCTKAGPDILLEEDGTSSLCGVSNDARETAHQAISRAITSFLATD